MATIPQVTLFSRRGCCLCEDAHEVLEEALKHARFALEVQDIDADPDLQLEYNNDVPVIAINGKRAFKHRVELREFLIKLAART